MIIYSGSQAAAVTPLGSCLPQQQPALKAQDLLGVCMSVSMGRTKGTWGLKEAAYLPSFIAVSNKEK